MLAATKTAVAIEVNLYHQSCPDQETWRREGGEGFPRFVPFLHESYNRNKLFLKCEACQDVIVHSLVSLTDTEST